MLYADDYSKSDLVGDWEWLGNSFSKVSDYSKLTRTGPSIKRFHDDGVYEYISVFQGKSSPPVKGSWTLQSDVLSITRPDNGTFNYKILSFDNDVMETKDTDLGIFMYMRKK